MVTAMLLLQWALIIHLAGEIFLHSNYPKGNFSSIDHINYKNWFNSKHLKWAFILQLILQQTGIHSVTGIRQNTWRYFIGMDESHRVKFYWVVSTACTPILALLLLNRYQGLQTAQSQTSAWPEVRTKPEVPSNAPGCSSQFLRLCTHKKHS